MATSYNGNVKAELQWGASVICSVVNFPFVYSKCIRLSLLTELLAVITWVKFTQKCDRCLNYS